MIRSLGIAIPFIAVAASHAGVTTLNASLTADNLFTAYISTDDSLAGTAFASGASWPQTFNGSFDFLDAGTYYLHVAAVDQGLPAMFIGRFTLSGTDATFANGTQELLTNTTDWRVSSTGFNGVFGAPADLGPNGTSPWNSFPQMTTAHFIWAPNNPGTAFFSTTITVVPTGSSAVLFSAGLLTMMRRRR